MRQERVVAAVVGSLHARAVAAIAAAAVAVAAAAADVRVGAGAVVAAAAVAVAAVVVDNSAVVGSGKITILVLATDDRVVAAAWGGPVWRGGQALVKLLPGARTGEPRDEEQWVERGY